MLVYKCTVCGATTDTDILDGIKGTPLEREFTDPVCMICLRNADTIGGRIEDLDMFRTMVLTEKANI